MRVKSFLTNPFKQCSNKTSNIKNGARRHPQHPPAHQSQRSLPWTSFKTKNGRSYQRQSSPLWICRASPDNGSRILIFSVNPIRRDANTYADADTNQGQHARMSRTCPGACCAFDDSVRMSATLRRLVRESERCAVF